MDDIVKGFQRGLAEKKAAEVLAAIAKGFSAPMPGQFVKTWLDPVTGEIKHEAAPVEQPLDLGRRMNITLTRAALEALPFREDSKYYNTLNYYRVRAYPRMVFRFMGKNENAPDWACYYIRLG